MQISRIKLTAVLVIGIISISFGSIFVKFCNDVPAIMIATYRVVMASIILLGIAGFKRIDVKAIGKKHLFYGALGGFFLALHFGTWITSLKYTSVASSVVLVNTNPIFVGLFAFIFLKERQSIEMVVGIVLSVLGTLILALGDSSPDALAPANKSALFGDALALAGAIAGSGYIIIGSKLRQKLDIFTYITLVYSFAGLFLLITAIFSGCYFTGYRPASYIFLVLLALVPQLLGHSSFNWALKHLKASMVAITILGEPVAASILAYFFFNEQVRPFQFLGFLLVVTAIYIAAKGGYKS